MTDRLRMLGGALAMLALLPGTAPAFDHAGLAAVEGALGGMLYFADDDSRASARPRPSAAAIFEYSPGVGSAVRLSVGVGWNSYPDDKSPSVTEGDPRPVKVVSPMTLTVLRRLGADSERFLFVGGGLGLYYWRYRISGTTQIDPVTFENIQSGRIGSFDFGFHGMLGYEFPLADKVSLSVETLGHYIFSANDTDRPDKASDSPFADDPVFNGNDLYADFRLGVKLYFDLIRFESDDGDF